MIPDGARRWGWLTVCALVAFLLVLGTATPALAQADARTAYREGVKAYNLGEFNRAVELFKKAYELKEDPVFLFNIAQAYRLAGDAGQALFFYRSYLRTHPDAENRVEVEGRIKELEGQRAAQRPPQPATAPLPAAVAPPAEPRLEAAAPGSTAAPPTPSAATAPAMTPAPIAQERGALDLDSSAAPQDAGDAPLYAKWWLWAGVGAVVLGVVLIATLSGGDVSPRAPDSHFGTIVVF